MNTLVLGTAYFPPVQYFSKIINIKELHIEVYDHYHKQSFRNRCEIAGGNGKQCLSIPVKKNHNTKTLCRDVRIDYDTDWQKNHYRSLVSAYKSSPFFEFYFDDFTWVFETKTSYLVDLNERIMLELLGNLGKAIVLERTHHFEAMNERDLRELIHPKSDFSKDPDFEPVPYQQVFTDRHGFIPNLSILDLLFNKGPEAVSILEASNRA